VTALTAALRDPHQRVRLASARALGQIGPLAAPALPALHAMLRDPVVSLRVAAAADLWSIAGQSDGSVQILVEATADSDATIRLAAVEQLGRMQAHTSAALASLVADIKDHDASVSIAALTSLGEIGPDARATASAPLRQLLEDSHPEYRLLAARALWHVDFHPAELLPVLLTALQDRNETVRDAAAHLLGEIGRPAFPAAGALHERLKDPAPYVRVDAAVALWRIEGNLDDVLPLLIRIIRDRDGADPYLRQFAVISLGEIGPPARDAIPVIMEVSEDEFASVRAAAAVALRNIKVENRRKQ
jgi:HEAT repeat protein